MRKNKITYFDKLIEMESEKICAFFQKIERKHLREINI